MSERRETPELQPQGLASGDVLAATKESIAEELRLLCEEIDAELGQAVEALEGAAIVGRQELYERAVKQKVSALIRLERSVRAGLGLDFSAERWHRVSEDAVNLVDDSVSDYLRSLDMVMAMGGADPGLASPAAELRDRAEGLRRHLQADASWQVDVERRRGRLPGGAAVDKRPGVVRVGIARIRLALARVRGGQGPAPPLP